MSSPIVVLSADLASQIAAGEVVERPASVIKELVENSLDAGATRVDVSIVGGGVASITIQDDGMGMDATTAPLCLERHATSKLAALDDLLSIGSFGFRGEALPSIASVSRLSITTRSQVVDAGLHLQAEGTTAPLVSPRGAPVGTTIEVKDLFFNVPARRKFLKSSNTEAGHVAETITHLALSRPDVTLTLHRDGRLARKFPRVHSRRDRVQQVLEGETLLEAIGERGPLRVEAYLCPPDRARVGAAGLRLFVNGRVVKDRALAGTTAHAFGKALDKGHYPRGVIYLDLPGDLVDVNVHPQKTEVRFADPRAVADALHHVIGRAVSAAITDAPSAPGPAPATPASTQSSLGARAAAAASPRILRDGARSATGQRYWSDAGPTGTAGRSPVQVAPQRHQSEAAPPTPSPAPLATSEGSGRRWRYAGQARGFLILEAPQGLLLVDPHALSECLLLQELTLAFEGPGVSQRPLLFPKALGLASDEQSESAALNLKQLGFDISVNASGALLLCAAPSLPHPRDPGELLQAVRRAGTNSGALLVLACEGAHPRGQALSQDEALRFTDALSRGAIDEALMTRAKHGNWEAGCVTWPDELPLVLGSERAPPGSTKS